MAGFLMGFTASGWIGGVGFFFLIFFGDGGWRCLTMGCGFLFYVYFFNL